MQGGWLIFAFLVATAVFAVLSKRIGVAYPIVCVVGGALLGFIPNLPPIELEPDLIFLIVLPVFLFSSGWTTDWSAFKADLRPIGLLAVGLVVFTIGAVALISHAVIPGLSWPAAFALGAILAPTDSVAAEAIAERLTLPRRILTIATGESLVNDAAALTIYQFAVAAAVAGTFSAKAVVPQFFFVAIGGVLVGLIVAAALELLLERLHERDLDDEVLVNVVMLLAPFGSYLPALSLHVSGVLAAVACGIYLSRRSAIMSPDTRILAYGIWEMLTYLLNAFVFLLLGLQLRSIVAAVGRESFAHLAWYAVAISAAVITLRFVWVYAAAFLPRLLVRALRRSDTPPPWQGPFVLSWAGMRGIVSLTAALALPATVAGGTHFPRRNEIIFVTFCVILATLVVMGVTFPFIIRLLGLRDDGAMREREIALRIRALESGLERLREIEVEFDSELEWETQGRIATQYRHRIEHLRDHLEGSAGMQEITESAIDHRLEGEALSAERRTIQELRTRGEIPDDIYRNIEYDLDLADARLRKG